MVLVLIFVCIALLMYMQFKASNDDIKTEAIEFDTQKTVQQIANELRSFRCNIRELEYDPLAGVSSGSKPEIGVLMSGRATISDAFKHFGAGMSEWGVQVYVYDLGNKRHVELVALGESAMGAGYRGYVNGGGGNDYCNMKHSKDYRDRIAQRIS